MTAKKTVLVFGTGFAGQGHAKAFRDAGADVVGIVGRTAHVVEQVASDLNIDYFGTDWALALETCKPDIVAIATPGGAHVEPIKLAIEFGCHIFCDKPLTASGESSLEIYRLAQQRGVKTAYASSFRYLPNILHAKQLVEQGVIGEPTEVECISHFNLDRHIPFGWSHTKAAGGGRLNNNFTHLLSIVTSVIGDNILSICGEVRNDMPKAPLVSGVHNFTQRREYIPKDINDPNLAWCECDVEWSYTVMAQLESRIPAPNPVSVLFKHGGLVPRFNEDHIVFHGSKGSIYISGHYGGGTLYIWDGIDWIEQTVPTEISNTLPNINDDTQRSWTHLAQRFVADVAGVGNADYQTFYDGCRYQQIIDLIRKNDRWVQVAELLD